MTILTFEEFLDEWSLKTPKEGGLKTPREKMKTPKEGGLMTPREIASAGGKASAERKKKLKKDEE